MAGTDIPLERRRGEDGGVRVLGLGTLLVAGALAGCGGAGADVPEAVKTMMAAEFPADGQIHVQSRGKIAIRPETFVCEVWKGVPDNEVDGYFGINSRELFRPLGQSWGNGSGGDRQIPATNPVCQKAGNVTVFGKKSNNRNGTPYKLVLAVWQGDPATGGAVWVGGMERLGQLPIKLPRGPDNMPVPNDGQPQLTEKDIEEAKATYERDLIAWNARNDIETISNKFAKFVSEEI